jgi:3-hydroxyisobutyrate dehydrogenase-like beta-hydroxyacid dehydrogenase
MKVAFIGLGRMGSGMAHNLLRAGHDLTVYNRSREKADALVRDGAHAAGSPAEAAHGAEAVFTMLSDDHAVEEVVCGDRGIAGALGTGAVHVSSSTISTALSRRLTAIHSARNQGYLSAPVFGRPDAAEAKRLVVVPAGPADLIAKCQPLFDAIGRQTFIAGDEPFLANALKLCGNFMIMTMLEAFGEAYATLRKAGVDPHTYLDVMNSLFGSPVMANYGKIIADEQFEPAGFALKLGLKDVRLVLSTAEECASPMPFASVIRDHFLAAMAHGQGELDWSSVTRVSAKMAGIVS